MKEVKKGQRVNTGVEKIDKQVHIYGVHGQKRAMLRAQVSSV